MSDNRETGVADPQDRAATSSPDERDCLAADLGDLFDRARSEGRGLDAALLLAARAAVEMLDALLIEVRGHRFDTVHLIERYAAQGQEFLPRLADQRLYEAAGLDRIPDAASASGSSLDGDR
jgi:hypothetical protein